ncbi:hypothetical protein ACFLY9_00155 [Patescibacteria group bacterium]
MNKILKGLKYIVIVFILTITIAFIVFLLVRGDDSSTTEEEIPEESDEDIQREVYNGILPKSGDLIEVDNEESSIVVSIDEVEEKYYTSSEFDCKQVGLPGQTCLGVSEDTECDFEIRFCELENIEVDKVLGVDLELDSDNKVSFLRVFYVAE